MKKWMIVLLAVLLVILLACGGYIIWKNTTNKSAAEEETKYETFEETEAKLIPVNMSCEDKGIRMTVVGALLTEKQLWIELELQDLEGGRIDRDYIYQSPDDWFAYNIGIKEDRKTTMFSYPETGHCKLIKKFWYYQKEDKDNLSVGLNCIHSIGKTSIPVLPLLEQYGKTYKGMPIPKNKYKNISYSSEISPDEIKVLDSNPWLEQPISDDPEMKNILLSGIGWLDGQLHIQIHNTDKNIKYSGSSYSAPFRCTPDYSKYHASNPDMYTVEWSDGDYRNIDWTEFIIACQPEELEDMNYSLDLTYIREILKGNWEINIPLDRIRASDDVAGEIDSQPDPLEAAKMVYYDFYNGTGEAVVEYGLDGFTAKPDGGWKGEGSTSHGISTAYENRDSVLFHYKTESGYEYETTLPLCENIPRTVITMLPKAGGGGINVAYPEPEPTAVPAGS